MVKVLEAILFPPPCGEGPSEGRGWGYGRVNGRQSPTPIRLATLATFPARGKDKVCKVPSC
jgi:hypothetical protein